MTDSEKLDTINKRLKNVELRQTIQLLVVVLGALGILAAIKTKLKNI
jgi:hypothetical protein